MNLRTTTGRVSYSCSHLRNRRRDTPITTVAPSRESCESYGRVLPGELPERYGSWKPVNSRFLRWSAGIRRGLWARILTRLQQDAAGARNKGAPETKDSDGAATASGARSTCPPLALV